MRNSFVVLVPVLTERAFTAAGSGEARFGIDRVHRHQRVASA